MGDGTFSLPWYSGPTSWHPLPASAQQEQLDQRSALRPSTVRILVLRRRLDVVPHNKPRNLQCHRIGTFLPASRLVRGPKEAVAVTEEPCLCRDVGWRSGESLA